MKLIVRFTWGLEPVFSITKPLQSDAAAGVPSVIFPVYLKQWG